MMRRIFYSTLALALMPFLAQAQSASDALRYSQIFYTGTARSAAMGNAMTALGGDFGSLSINPAGSAVYPYSEVVFTPALHTSLAKSDYLSTTSNESRTRPGISNFGYIGAYRNRNNYGGSGFIGLSIGVGYNALNNYTDRFSATGITDQSSWLASLAYNTTGIQATSMDDSQDPFYTSNAPWRSILAWNLTLLDTIPGTGGLQYKGATEAYFGNTIGIPGSLRQNYSRESNGNVGEYLINIGVNIGQQFFFGANIGLQSIWYDFSESYSEAAVNTGDFPQTAFRDFTHTYNQSTSGTGVNLKFGIIYLPVNNLRIGASISSPTWMRLHDEWQETMWADYSDDYHPGTLLSPIGEYDYKVTTPFRWNVGVAYTFGSFGAISLDYEQAAYSKIKMNSTESYNPFDNDNTYIKNNYKNSSIFRAGLEMNLNKEFALRGGYSYYENPEKNYGNDTHIASLGLGLRFGSFFSDLTFMQRFPQKENFALYDDVYDDGHQIVYAAPVGTQTVSNWKLLLSLGVRF